MPAITLSSKVMLRMVNSPNLLAVSTLLRDMRQHKMRQQLVLCSRQYSRFCRCLVAPFLLRAMLEILTSMQLLSLALALKASAEHEKSRDRKEGRKQVRNGATCNARKKRTSGCSEPFSPRNLRPRYPPPYGWATSCCQVNCLEEYLCHPNSSFVDMA